jgi:hypothetical protein
MILRILQYIIATLIALLAVAFVADFVIFLYRSHTGRAFDTRTVRATYAIPQKNGRAELDFGNPVTITCVRALFPHNGDSPCWYVDRNANKTILF